MQIPAKLWLGLSETLRFFFVVVYFACVVETLMPGRG
jgi:hypothetical protein